MALMDGFIDMHAHTTASDGKLTPTELVSLASSLGLSGVAITDHDTTSGVEEGLEAAKQQGIILLPGIEISTVSNNQEIHVLGYFTNNKDEEWRSRINRLGATREARNDMLISKLQQLGFEITLQEVENVRGDSSSGSVGRPHFAQVLIEKGYVKSKQQAFDELLGENGAAYVQPERITPETAFEWIKEAGGVSVLAHPGIYHNDELVKQLLQAGVDGVEVKHSDHSLEQIQKYDQWADQFQLLKTAGSDFHGIDEQGRHFHGQLGGMHTTMAVYEQILRLHQNRV